MAFNSVNYIRLSLLFFFFFLLVHYLFVDLPQRETQTEGQRKKKEREGGWEDRGWGRILWWRICWTHVNNSQFSSSSPSSSKSLLSFTSPPPDLLLSLPLIWTHFFCLIDHLGVAFHLILFQSQLPRSALQLIIIFSRFSLLERES